jgi:hypothetical protein
MQRLEVSGAVRHIYVIRRLKVNKTWIILTDFRKKKRYSSSKFHENPFNESPVFVCGQTDRDMTKPVFGFRNFAKAPRYEILRTVFEVKTKWGMEDAA